MKHLRLFADTPHPVSASHIALGCDHYGDTVPEKTAFAVMDAYFESGGNVFDTAHIYAQMEDGGVSKSEKTLAEWIRVNNVRDKIVLVTKGAHPPRDNMTRVRLTEKDIKADLDLSLETLGVDSVDVWFAHRDNPAAPAAEVLDLMADAAKGRVKHLGGSNWTGARMDEANAHARKTGGPGIEISQIQWSLALSTKESWEDPSLVVMDAAEAAWYERTQMPVMLFSPQAHGLFTKVIERGADSVPEKSAKRFLLKENMPRIERCREVSERTGVNPAGICLAYLTAAAFPAMPIIGCSRPEQVADSLRFADYELSAEDRKFLAGK